MSGRSRLLLASLALFAPLLAWRQPDLLLHATFWGEDGWIWYPQAYRLGARCLLLPWTGYLQSFSRLAALAALPMPLAWAPTLFACMGFATELAVALFLLSTRMDDAFPSLPARFAFCLLYLLLPNSFEVVGRLTDAQWHLALLAFLLVVARPAAGPVGRGLDLAVLAVSGLSGPMGLLLLPAALLEWRARGLRDARAASVFAVLAATGAVQLGLLLSPGSNRSRATLGATPMLFARILAQQVVLGAELGRHAMEGIRASGAWRGGALPVSVSVAALATVAAALAHGPALLRRFCSFAGLVFAAGLASPMVCAPDRVWRALAMPDIGDRYYVYPMLAWFACLLALAASPSRPARAWGAVLLGIAVANLPGDYRFGTALAAGHRTDFVARAEAFRRAPPGTTTVFPVHPDGVQGMTLVK